MTSEPDLQHILEFPVSWSSWLRQFEILDFRMFATPRLHRFKIPENRMFAILRLHRFKIPEIHVFAIPRLRRFKIPENRVCFAPEKHILRILLNSTFRGWQVFLNSPTVSTQTFPWIWYHWNTLRWELQRYPCACGFIRVTLKYPTPTYQWAQQTLSVP
jgi:hypothetical protein